MRADTCMYQKMIYRYTDIDIDIYRYTDINHNITFNRKNVSKVR